jgi:hypothetical protein
MKFKNSLAIGIVSSVLSFLSLGTASLAADVRISGDNGGSLGAYMEKYNSLRQADAKIVIEDFCISACTFVLGLIPVENVCVSPFAQFGFHSATIGGSDTYAPSGTAMMWTTYPEHVKVRLRKLGWDGGEHPELVFIKGTDLLPLCPEYVPVDE